MKLHPRKAAQVLVQVTSSALFVRVVKTRRWIGERHEDFSIHSTQPTQLEPGRVEALGEATIT